MYRLSEQFHFHFLPLLYNLLDIILQRAVLSSSWFSNESLSLKFHSVLTSLYPRSNHFETG
jgi:hypothetical protein